MLQLSRLWPNPQTKGWSVQFTSSLRLLVFVKMKYIIFSI